MWVFTFDAPAIHGIPNQARNLGALPFGYLEAFSQARVGHDIVGEKFKHSMLVTSFDAFGLRHVRKLLGRIECYLEGVFHGG